MLNFFNNNKTEAKQKQEKERLLRKVLGKESERRVFGFKCDPSLPADLKLKAGKLNVPEFALAEHALELGLRQIKEAASDPEESEELRLHLVEVHVAKRTGEKLARYDEEAADALRRDMMRRLNIDRTVRQVVEGFVKEGMAPRDIRGYILYGYMCLMAVTHHRPIPEPTEAMFGQNSQGGESRDSSESGKQ